MSGSIEAVDILLTNGARTDIVAGVSYILLYCIMLIDVYTFMCNHVLLTISITCA